ncbi:MAG: hypothetical protein GY810_04115 [Aureispira sp.]|nr:hypothetical protein [Aureispira sp.]
MTKSQKIFSTIGLIGFIIMIPVVMHVLGYSDTLNALEQSIGVFGSASVLTLVGFSLMSLTFLFGGGENASATFIGFVAGFFLISTVVEFGFMQWFRDFSQNIGFLSNLKLNYLLGLGIIVLGLVFSFSKRVSTFTELLLLLIIPISFLGASHSYGMFSEEGQNFNISVDKGFESLAQLVDKDYRNNPEINNYIEDVHENENLSEAEKLEKIEELQKKIQKMQDDQRTLEDLKKENEQYQDLINKQKKELSEFGWCAGSRDSSVQVKKFGDAVTTDQPCVRDFAVSLVKNEPGAYYDYTDMIPGKSGIRQVCNLHTYLSSNWKYITDPMALNNDFYSPADRSIAIGLAGDCDDFSILMAACIESIGGHARIMGGTCSGGGHAWAEVMIGNKKDWNRMTPLIRKYFKNNSMELTASVDKDGDYWLPLDWKMGQFTCNDNPRTLMVLYNSTQKMNNYPF